MFANVTPIIIVQAVCLLFCLAVLFFLAEQKPSKQQQAFFRVSIFALVVVFGYFILQLSRSEEMTRLGYRLLFFGCCFYYYYSMRFYSRLVYYKPPKPVRAVFLALTVFICLSAVTFDVNGFFYKSIRPYVMPTGIVVLLTESGFGEILYNAVCIFFALVSVVVVFTHKRNTSRTRQGQATLLGFVALLAPVGFFLEVFLNKGYFLPIAVSIGQVVLVWLIYATGLYDTDDTIRAEAFRGMGDAIVAFDEKGRYRGANTLARSLFPALSNISHREVLAKEMFPVLTELINGSRTEFESDGRLFEATVKDVKGDKNIKALWLRDVTVQREHDALMKNYQTELEKEVEEKTHRITEMQGRIVRGMADIIENRDDNTGGHVKRTSYVVALLVDALQKDGYPGVTGDFKRIVTDSAPLHDIGKISIPDAILQKPGRLTDDEFGVMKSHSSTGAGMVSRLFEGIEYPEVIGISEHIARSHHEKWDGSGYPDRLADEQIPLEARIMAVADVYDALVSKRCYKDPMSFEEAYDIINGGFGSQFDPSLKKVFDECRADIEAFYTKERGEE